MTYWREEPLEVDGVLEGSGGSWAIEVKTGPFGSADVRGLLEFTRRFPRYQPLVLCDASALPAAARIGVPAMSWKRFLLEGRYFLIGSDTHKPDTLEHRMKGIDQAINIAGQKVVDQLMIQNPQLLLPTT